jgi:hypothetical protein
MITLMIKAVELGVQTIQIVAYESIIQAFKTAQEKISEKIYSTAVIGCRQMSPMAPITRARQDF